MGTCTDKMRLYASSWGGGRFFPLDQAVEIAKNQLPAAQREGVCAGISMVWLAAARNGEQFGELKNHKTTWKFISQVQAVFDGTRNAPAASATYNAKLANIWSATGFRYGGTHDSKMMYDSIGRYIGRSPGYYMLIVPGHAMAAVNGGKVFGFLDPNGGQATFKDEDEFSIFLSRYLLDAHISNLYEIALDKNPVRVYRLA